jgi:hypothetical protein
VGQFFGFERPTVPYAVVACVLVGLWSGFAVAICQGMAWFKRLAVVALSAPLRPSIHILRGENRAPSPGASKLLTRFREPAVFH